MFCQICGARIPEWRSACVQCGALAGGRAASAMVAASHSAAALSTDVHSCPRCGYQGSSAAYFSTSPHLLALIISAVAFAPAAFIYFALRYNYRVCPSCGEGWGKHAQLALPPGGDAGRMAMGQVPADIAGMSDGGAKRVFGWILMVLGAMVMIPGLIEMEPAAMLFAGLFAGGGFLLRKSANEDRVRRREAILQSLQRPVLQLAAKRHGTLTVTEVAAEFGWSLPRAEKVLQSLEDGYRVMGDVTSDGVIVYNFLELVPLPQAPEPPRAIPSERPPLGADSNTVR